MAYPGGRSGYGAGLARRGAIWAIHVLRYALLPLFAAATGQQAEETPKSSLALRPMAAGGDVAEEYRVVAPRPPGLVSALGSSS